jgi:hypothetical protein
MNGWVIVAICVLALLIPLGAEGDKKFEKACREQGGEVLKTLKQSSCVTAGTKIIKVK